MLRILHDTKLDFIRLWKVAAVASTLLIVPGLLWLAASSFNYSIEFTGGTLLQVHFKQAPGVGAVREALAQGGLEGVEISTFGAPNEIVMRAQGSEAVAQQAQGAEAVARQVTTALDSRFGAGSYSIIRTEAVGPKVGSELRRQAIIATLIAFGLTLIYLAWRFEWRFGLAAVLATLHDSLATLAFIKYLDLELSLFVVGGILTVIGYSMNDTVVVFDRVRENLRSSKKESLRDLLNRSVNETLPRTVMTGTTTLATLLALIIFGGEVIRPFALVLLFGIIVGTFSSIYVAAPLLLLIERKWPRESKEMVGVKGAARFREEGAPPAAKRSKEPAPAR